MFGLFNKIPEISTKELSEKLSEEMILLDVRNPMEYRAGHISVAKNVPLNRIKSFKAAKEKKVYVICQSGFRSKKACKQLNKLGHQVINVKSGMNAWEGRTQSN